MGALQTGGGALAGYLVGAFYDHTPLSPGVTVATFAALTLLASGAADLPGALRRRRGEASVHVTCEA